MAAVMVLMPKVVKCVMEGLMPISEAAKTRLQKRFSGGEFHIGLDPAILLGDAQVISAGLIFVPLTIVIAILMPGNEILPFGDLATIGFFVAMAVGIHRGNLFRTLVSGTIIMVMTIWIANQTIAINTALAKSVGSSLVTGEATRIASLDQGGSPITYLLTQAVEPTDVAGFVVIGAVYVFCLVCTCLIFRSRSAARRRAAGLASAPSAGDEE